MMQSASETSLKNKYLEFLFIALLTSFPFGSFFASFSLGFMTVYPFLVILVLLFFMSLTTLKIPGNRLEKGYLLFLCFFVAYSLAFLPFTQNGSYALVDVRSVILMLMTSWVIVYLKDELGYEKWRRIFLRAFYFILALVTIIAIAEMLSGWHLAGAFTEKISVRQIEDNMSFMPVFLWDNPNNFLTYYLLIVGGIILLDTQIHNSYWKPISLLFGSLFFAAVEESRMGVLVTGLIIIGYSIFYLQRNKLWRRFFVYWPYWSILILGLVMVPLQHPIYRGIPPSREKVVETTVFKYPVPSAAREINPDLLVETYGNVQEDTLETITHPERNSNTERLSLAKNGFALFRESNFLGVGPGGFRYRHDTGDVPNYTHGNNGPHFWFIELLSQFGILIIIPYFTFFIIIFIIAIKLWRRPAMLPVILLLSLVLFSAVSVLPSAFLILDINWIFTILLLVVSGHAISVKSSGITE